MNKADKYENYAEGASGNFDEEGHFLDEQHDRLDNTLEKHNTDNKKQQLPIIWDRYQDFSSAYLSKYYDFVICDIFHHIKAFLLFPPNCSCGPSCRCSQLRKKIALTLNTNQYTQAQRFEPPDRLKAMKNICRIPEDHVYRELYVEAYPLSTIEKEWRAREKNGDFNIINQLVWTFLSLGETYQAFLGTKEVSFTEAVAMILGTHPIKTKVHPLKKKELLRGEKAYEKLFKHYKSVCHFIAALEFCKNEMPYGENLFTNSVYAPLSFTERFVNVAHWFRKNLLTLERRNVKGKVFLREEELCPLPDWIQTQEIDIPIEIFQGKLKELMSTAKLINPATKQVIKEGFACFSDSFIEKYLSES